VRCSSLRSRARSSSTATSSRSCSSDASYDACVARITGTLQAEAIVPVFQPIVSLADGRTIAYEALARFPGGPARRWA